MRLHFEKWPIVLAVLVSAASLSAQQIGKYVPVSAGSEATAQWRKSMQLAIPRKSLH
jgi:hypothetical protein